MRTLEQACQILESIDIELRDDFENTLRQSVSPNTKGHEYEKAVSRYLSSHLGSVFEFHTRARLVDRELAALRVLKPSENEFDVVGVFSHSCPRIVARTGDTPLIPYDAAAVIIEVKQDLTRRALEHDMRKLSLLSKFKYMGPLKDAIDPYGSKYARRPIRVLFYHRLRYNSELTLKFLTKNIRHWDMVMVYSADVLITNPRFPLSAFIGKSVEEEKPSKRNFSHFRVAKEFSLMFFIFSISHSMPESIALNTSNIYLSLLAPLMEAETKDKKRRGKATQGLGKSLTKGAGADGDPLH